MSDSQAARFTDPRELIGRGMGIFIAYREDELSDVEMLRRHIRDFRKSGNLVEAETLSAILDSFDRYVMLSEDSRSVELGGYMMFQFDVALQWARVFQLKCARGMSPYPSAEDRAEEWIARCADVFMGRVSRDASLNRFSGVERWIAAVDRTMPTELFAVSDGFLTALTAHLNALSNAPPLTRLEALQGYTASVMALPALADQELEMAAGAVLAWQCILRDVAKKERGSADV